LERGAWDTLDPAEQEAATAHLKAGMARVRAAVLHMLSSMGSGFAPMLARLQAESASHWAAMQATLRKPLVPPGFMQEVSHSLKWMDEQPLGRLPELARAAGGTATDPTEALAFLRDLGIDRWVELVRSQRDLERIAQAEASRMLRAKRASAWRTRGAAPVADDAHEARKHRVVGRLAAWLHAAGNPVAGDVQFPELKTAVLALSKAQLEGIWSELSLCAADVAVHTSAPVAWQHFLRASAIIIGVAGPSQSLRWLGLPSPTDGRSAIADDAHLVVDSPAGTPPAAAPPADPRIVEPEGGTWPHRGKAGWTDAERAAMQEMRDRGMTDAELAAVVGCSRQRVGQLIGSKIAAKSAAVTRAKLAGRA
jgi:hypothetical protein